MILAERRNFSAKLAEFLARVRSVLPTSPDVYWDVAFPEGGSLLLGSSAGRTIWESSEASSFLEYLLSSDRLAALYGPPSSQIGDLRFILAAVAQRWIESGRPAEDFAVEHADEIINQCEREVVACYGLTILHGVTLKEEVPLPFGLKAAPLTNEQVRSLPQHYPVLPADVIRLPAKPAVLLIAASAANRAQFGPYAGPTALGFARIGLWRLRDCIWLATGCLLSRSDEFLWFDSPFAPPLERVHAPPEQRFRTRGESDATIEAGALQAVVRQRMALWGDETWAADDETWLSWWMSESFVHAALDAADPLLTLLMCYAAVDGLLREPGEDDSRLSPRVAWLAATDTTKQRAVRRMMTGLREIRGKAAHGQRPHIRLIGAALGRQLSDEDIESGWPQTRDQLYRSLEQQTLEVLRRVLLALSWLLVDVEAPADPEAHPGAKPGLSRKQVLALLDECRLNNAETQRQLAILLTEPRRHFGSWLADGTN